MSHNISPLLLGSSLAGLVAVAAFNSWLSRINQFFFFSRTVDAEFAATPGARQIASGYLRRVRIAAAAAVLAYVFLVLSTLLSGLACFMTALALQSVLCCAAFARAHRETGAAIAERGAAAVDGGGISGSAVAVALRDPGVFTPALISMLWVALGAAVAAWLGPMLGMHIGFSAFADAIAANHAEFLTGLGAGLLAASVMLFVQLRYFSRHRSAMARFTASGCVQMAWLGSLMVALSTLSVPMHLVVTPAIRGVLVGAVLLVGVLRFTYGWMKARTFAPPAVERRGDEFWRWGLFYYNPGDPTLFIQHRCGPGYTVNYANRMAWVLTGLVVADVVFLVVMHLTR